MLINKKLAYMYIILLIVFVVFFIIQTYTLYNVYIPKVINSYEGALTVKSIENLHVQLTKIAAWLLPWPIFFFGLLVSNILHNLRKTGSESDVSPK